MFSPSSNFCGHNINLPAIGKPQWGKCVDNLLPNQDKLKCFIKSSKTNLIHTRPLQNKNDPSVHNQSLVCRCLIHGYENIPCLYSFCSSLFSPLCCHSPRLSRSPPYCCYQKCLPPVSESAPIHILFSRHVRAAGFGLAELPQFLEVPSKFRL